MCPVCITTTLALIAGSVTATGGLTALVVKTLHPKTGAAKPDTTESKSKGERQ